MHFNLRDGALSSLDLFDLQVLEGVQQHVLLVGCLLCEVVLLSAPLAQLVKDILRGTVFFLNSLFLLAEGDFEDGKGLAGLILAHALV